ncbi:MAG: AraC family ligand binding domain-containing protein, partial [Angelakisella sp.]
MHELVMQCEYSDCETLLRSHHHLSCEVIYVESGEALFTINKNSYHAQPGSVVLVNSYEQHSCQIVQTPYRRYFALIDLPALDYALHS